jgi:large subunit ribosomal protein L1
MSAMKKSKRLAQSYSLLNREEVYSVGDAIGLLKAFPSVKFDPSLEAAFNLNVDPRHSDQMIRGSIVLPNGIGKATRVAVIAGPEKSKEALQAGADLAGLEDIIEMVSKGDILFDRCIATPDAMPKLAAVGRILGPKGLMPNPKLGTVTNDVVEAVRNAKLGQVDFRTEKKGIVHASFGKLSFDKEKIAENLTALVTAIIRLRPKAVKSNYIRSLYVSATMAPAIKVSLSEF